MLKITQKIATRTAFTLSLTLPFEQRQKARLHTTLDNGQEAGLFLARGMVLRNGDKLKAESGEIIKIISASEQVSTATTNNALLLMRACYHLGNRHVPLEINAHYLRYQYDHVLDEMLARLGLNVVREWTCFEPESGAYAYHHARGHAQGHAHRHE